MKKELQILIVNDDGIDAPGLIHLANATKKLGQITIVAPQQQQSGKGHAITLTTPLRLIKKNLIPDVDSYECNGTPADCVKIAFSELFQNPPDICLSGINHGYNHSVNIVYSGTMGAAREANLMGVPSIGFSFGSHDYKADFTEVKKYVTQIVKTVVQKKNQETQILLNVNFPALAKGKKIKGIKICKQADGFFEQKPICRTDQYEQPYYWLSGKLVITNQDQDNDSKALQNGYISVVPMQSDFTNYVLKQKMQEWEFYN